jgi:tetratricopeptide (TPR) repeat protein
MAKKASFLDAFKGLGQKKGKGVKDKDIGKYEKILDETPDDRNALNTLGDLYAKRGDTEKACDHYLRVGELYAKDGFTLKAIAVYKKAQRAKPDLIRTYIDLAGLYVQKGLIGEAKSNYLTAAEMQAAAGAKHESLDTYRKIADLDPENVNIRSKLATMYEKEDFIEDAAIIYAEIGDVLILGDVKQGKNFYRRAIDLQPDNQEILSRIGYAYAEHSLQKEATEIFEQLLKLNPKNIDYKEQLEELRAVPDLQGAALPDKTSISFSEEELTSLNFGEQESVADIQNIPENIFDLQTTEAPPDDSQTANQEAEDSLLDFHIENQGSISWGGGTENQASSSEVSSSQDVHAINFSLDDSFDQGQEPAESEHNIAALEQPAPQADSPGASGYFDLASRLDTAAQIGREYEQHNQTRPSNLKVEASENLATSEISDIIKEFKQGVLEEVGAEDYETHYELGISYKEMSLLDDAIEELKLASLEPTKFVECQGVIGLCYIEKGEYSNAIRAFQEARAKVDPRSEEYQDLTYQIGLSYEEFGKVDEATQEFQALYQIKPNYRDIKQRLNKLLG